MIKIIYRISDNRNGDTLIESISKRHCFLNFIKVFDTTDLVVIADNAKQETIDFIRSHVSDVHLTSLGNSKSFLYALSEALKYDDADAVYLVEDDYLHLAGSLKIIQEGLARADYVSLYDHLDKYIDTGQNPFVSDGGENTKVILTNSTHWKYTNSTTMTFAARVETLRQDQDIFAQHCISGAPRDFQIFYALSKKGRKLITPIPGRSTHCDHFPSPFIFSQLSTNAPSYYKPIIKF